MQEFIHNFLNKKIQIGNLQTSTNILCVVIIVILCTISASIIFTTKKPKKIEKKEFSEDQTQRYIGAIIGTLTSLLCVGYICALVYSHNHDKKMTKNWPIIVTSILKLGFILIMWVAFYIIPIINYVKYGWKPLLDNPPKDSNEYNAQYGFRIFMNIFILILGMYCTLRFFGIFKQNDILDDFTISYIVVSIAMFAAIINLAEAANLATTDDVLLSS